MYSRPGELLPPISLRMRLGLPKPGQIDPHLIRGTWGVRRGGGRGRGRGRDYIHRSLTFMKLPSSTMGFARVSFLLSKHVEGGGAAGGWRGEAGEGG